MKRDYLIPSYLFRTKNVLSDVFIVVMIAMMMYCVIDQIDQIDGDIVRRVPVLHNALDQFNVNYNYPSDENECMVEFIMLLK